MGVKYTCRCEGTQPFWSGCLAGCTHSDSAATRSVPDRRRLPALMLVTRFGTLLAPNGFVAWGRRSTAALTRASWCTTSQISSRFTVANSTATRSSTQHNQWIPRTFRLSCWGTRAICATKGRSSQSKSRNGAGRWASPHGSRPPRRTILQSKRPSDTLPSGCVLHRFSWSHTFANRPVTLRRI